VAVAEILAFSSAAFRLLEENEAVANQIGGELLADRAEECATRARPSRAEIVRPSKVDVDA